MEFVEILRNQMNKNNLIQADLCRITGIPTSLMSNYMNGKKSPALSNARKISKALGITLDELAGTKIKTNKDLVLSEKDKEIILAYRKHPEMHIAIDSMLRIEEREYFKKGA